MNHDWFLANNFPYLIVSLRVIKNGHLSPNNNDDFCKDKGWIEKVGIKRKFETKIETKR